MPPPSAASAPCLARPDALLVDGANAVCAAPRDAPEVPLPTGALALSIALTLALVMIGRRALFPRAAPARAQRPRPATALRALALALLVGAAAPGWTALLARRADAPARLPATSAAVRALLDPLTRFADAHRGCVLVARNACVACEPAVRYALPARPRQCRDAAAAPTATLALGADAFDAARSCRRADATAAPTDPAATSAAPAHLACDDPPAAPGARAP